MANEIEAKVLCEIADTLSAWHKAVVGGEPATMQLQLTELYKVIKTLMDETFKAKERQLKIALALLEKRARGYKQEIERILTMKN